MGVFLFLLTSKNKGYIILSRTLSEKQRVRLHTLRTDRILRRCGLTNGDLALHHSREAEEQEKILDTVQYADTANAVKSVLEAHKRRLAELRDTTPQESMHPTVIGSRYISQH